MPPAIMKVGEGKHVAANWVNLMDRRTLHPLPVSVDSATIVSTV